MGNSLGRKGVATLEWTTLLKIAIVHEPMQPLNNLVFLEFFRIQEREDEQVRQELFPHMQIIITADPENPLPALFWRGRHRNKRIAQPR